MNKLPMKRMLLIATLLAASFATHAEPSTDRALVEKYLSSMQFEQVVAAQLNSYAEQFSKGQDEAGKARIRTFLNEFMGWEAIKDQYIGLIQKIYAPAEIKAALAFMNSPIGESLKQKNITFSSQASALMAQRYQELAAKAKPPADDARHEDAAAEDDTKNLTAHQVEEVKSAAGNVYFTGEVRNAGKKLARSLSVVVNLFQGDKFVDQYSTYLNGAVPAGGSRYFKVSCSCDGKQPAPHDSFKVEVVSAY